MPTDQLFESAFQSHSVPDGTRTEGNSASIFEEDDHEEWNFGIPRWKDGFVIDSIGRLTSYARTLLRIDREEAALKENYEAAKINLETERADYKRKYESQAAAFIATTNAEAGKKSKFIDTVYCRVGSRAAGNTFRVDDRDALMEFCRRMYPEAIVEKIIPEQRVEVLPEEFVRETFKVTAPDPTTGQILPCNLPPGMHYTPAKESVSVSMVRASKALVEE